MLRTISDAGTPGISDPGWKLVSQCHTRGIPVHSLAGPSSLAAALSTAGQPSRRFLFAGFPPNKKSERRAFLKELSEQKIPTVFFETPHQIGETLQWLARCCEPERSLSICRELTKLHETNQKRSLADWLLNPPPSRGEFVLVLEKAPEEPDQGNGNAAEQAAYLLASGLGAAQTREFLEQFALLTRNQAYQLVLECQQKISAKPD